MSTAWNLKEERKKLNLSQAEMAEKLGIKQSYYSAIERGEKQPSKNVLEALKKLKINSNSNIGIDYFALAKEGERLKISLIDFLKTEHKELLTLYQTLEGFKKLARILEGFSDSITIEDISDVANYVQYKNGLPSNHPIVIGDKVYKENIIDFLQEVEPYANEIVLFRKQLMTFLTAVKPLDVGYIPSTF